MFAKIGNKIQDFVDGIGQDSKNSSKKTPKKAVVSPHSPAAKTARVASPVSYQDIYVYEVSIPKTKEEFREKYVKIRPTPFLTI